MSERKRKFSKCLKFSMSERFVEFADVCQKNLVSFAETLEEKGELHRHVGENRRVHRSQEK